MCDSSNWIRPPLSNSPGAHCYTWEVPQGVRYLYRWWASGIYPKMFVVWFVFLLLLLYTWGCGLFTLCPFDPDAADTHSSHVENPSRRVFFSLIHHHRRANKPWVPPEIFTNGRRRTAFPPPPPPPPPVFYSAVAEEEASSSAVYTPKHMRNYHLQLLSLSSCLAALYMIVSSKLILSGQWTLLLSTSFFLRFSFSF